MNIVVLVKHAFTPASWLKIGTDGKSFEKKTLIYEMNEWDRYAFEEAIKIKEQKGAEVVAVSVGKDCEDTLRRCLALGADRAIKIPYDSMDSLQISEAIHMSIKDERLDLILSGFQSQDLNSGLVGPILAGMLGLPYVIAVISIELEDGGVRVKRELEGGFQEEIKLPLPCLIAVQTGINQPRYASIKGVLRAKAREIKESPVIPKSSTFEIEKLYFPMAREATRIEGSAEEVSIKLIELLKERELL
jgi:electron transfer flavoprotein beta subunit